MAASIPQSRTDPTRKTRHFTRFYGPRVARACPAEQVVSSSAVAYQDALRALDSPCLQAASGSAKGGLTCAPHFAPRGVSPRCANRSWLGLLVMQAGMADALVCSVNTPSRSAHTEQIGAHKEKENHDQDHSHPSHEGSAVTRLLPSARAGDRSVQRLIASYRGESHGDNI